MKKFFAVATAFTTAAFVALSGSPASAYSGANSWNDAGLRVVVSETGKYVMSTDGLGTLDGVGTVQVTKGAGQTVKSAYFMAAQVQPGDKPTLNTASAIQLNGVPVTFKYESEDLGVSMGNNFNNYFADVTSIVKPVVDAASAGTVDLSVTEGGLMVEGTSLVVILNESSVQTSTVIIGFGNSSTAGDTFDIEFNALTAPQTSDLQLSLGITFSYQYEEIQTTDVTVNGTLMTDSAGGWDDCESDGLLDESDFPICADDALITVGGVGNSLGLPTPGTQTSPDDELYSLSSYVSVGDTSLVVETRNASGDDNVFMAAFYLKNILATVGGESGGGGSGGGGSGGGDDTLANTGISAPVATGALVAGLGAALLAAFIRPRRRARN